MGHHTRVIRPKNPPPIEYLFIYTSSMWLRVNVVSPRPILPVPIVPYVATTPKELFKR